ncbi:ferrous iron transport protein A [Vibrio sp. 404]|uniref:Ferrous iron transport protein A n=1 Tax=Vibrio marinisediminis TaxID=2758441 RepID=A0A7W2IST5_9VIBR|nr:FeoA family protein [Vibrio marinisediminis]MBA5761438.1 ferrous iron transport protein A [Vibrio marinisediminis]
MRTSLSKILPGTKGIIVSHHAQGAIRQRLLDLGLMPEMEVELIRYAPMGDPIEIKVGLTNVVIRKTEAETVTIDVNK